jgi:hypothetical protein
MNNCENLTITPINKQLRSKSNMDFVEQLARTRTGELNWCWDDSKYNKAKSGQYFAFMFYGKKVIIHRILAVKPPSERLPSWSLNVGQTDRNVLELSLPLKELSWEEWINNDGPEAHLGTYTTKNLSGTHLLYNILQSLEIEKDHIKIDIKEIDIEEVTNYNKDNYVQSLERENLWLKNELMYLREALKNKHL